MRRRMVLASGAATVAASLAGCLGGLAAPRGDGEMMVENIQIDDEQPGPLAVDIEWLETRLSEETHPQFEVTVENTADEPFAIYTVTAHRPEFPLIKVQPDPLLLLLFDPEETLTDLGTNEDSYIDDDGCQRTSSHFVTFTTPRNVEWLLQVGERRSRTYAILANDRRIEGTCPPAQTYTARATYSFELPPDSDRFTEEWGFEFDLVE